MSIQTRAGDESTGTDDGTAALEPREARALTEYMTVLDDVDEARDAPGLYRVVGQHGSTYTVDARSGACTCPDATHRLAPDERCKHAARVAFATGERAIPAWVDRDDVDPDLGAHVDGPRFAATDGGQVTLGEAGDETAADDTDEAAADAEECDCDELPDDWPCARCYVAGEAELPGGWT
jgi:hypothetical protein